MSTNYFFFFKFSSVSCEEIIPTDLVRTPWTTKFHYNNFSFNLFALAMSDIAMEFKLQKRVTKKLFSITDMSILLLVLLLCF